LNLDEKKKIVEDLHDKFTKCKVAIVTDYKGLDVTSINDLRRKLRESEVEYKVIKNTLLRRASEGTELSLIKDSFKGTTAIALSYKDSTASAKVLTQFASDNDLLEIKSGVINGRILDLSAIKSLSSLPSKEILLGQFLSLINSVPTSFVRALNNIPCRLLNLLQAIKESKEAG